MSTIKVNNITTRSGCTMTLGESGKTITIPAGATISNAGTQTGFGRTGTVNWQTSIKTESFTAVNGEGYFIDTADSGSPFKNYAITVASGTLYVVGGTGNVFNLDGSRQTAITLMKGKTYRFTQSDATNDGHPLVISTSNSSTLSTFQAGIVSSGITYYLDGASNQSNYTNTSNFNGATTRYVEFQPQTTGTFYYGCYVHGIGMGGGITSQNVTITLPSSPSAGNIVSVKDYAGTFDSNNLSVGRNGSNFNGGSDIDPTFDGEGAFLTFIYADSTKGWLVTDDSNNTTTAANTFIAATGGNSTLTNGDFKTHVFTGPGTFCVSASAGPVGVAEYMVIAGGGGAEQYAGGGAGGFRSTTFACISAPVTSPLGTATKLTMTAGAYPIVVGGGGATAETLGSISSFSTITSGGGGGGKADPNGVGQDGGSGGGGRGAPAYPGTGYSGGSGNTPPVSPPQGNDGGKGFDGISVNTQGGGGGGAGAVGGDAAPAQGGTGGIGTYNADSLFGPTAPSYGTPGPVSSTRYFSGGGGGATNSPASQTNAGGAGGGGQADGNGSAGTANTGGGAGGGGSPGTARAGGSGIVVIRYKYQ